MKTPIEVKILHRSSQMKVLSIVIKRSTIFQKHRGSVRQLINTKTCMCYSRLQIAH